VVRALHAAGAEVVQVTRAGGTSPPETARVTSVAVDLARPEVARELLRRFRPAITFNLAGHGVDPAERDAGEAEAINIALPQALAAEAVASQDGAWPGQQLVHAGSALEYGTATGNLHESTTEAPDTLYGTTKLEGTRAVTAAMRDHGLRAVVTRLFTVYGPGEHSTRLLPTLLRARTHDHPIPLTAGTQRRDFTHVGDVVEAMLRLGTLAAPAVGIVNVATGELTSVRDFALRAAGVLGIAPARLEFGALPTRREEMAHDPVAVARLVTLVGWRPSTTIEAGVANTLAAG
jgi:nucleoside-diphosphate-sugar epimerase